MWLCKLLGHKFIKTRWDTTWTSHYCWRCGFQRGTDAAAPSPRNEDTK